MATKTNVLWADLEYIRRALAVLVEPDATFELRVPKAPRAGTVSGYFDDLAAAAKAAAWSGKAPGVYFTINPVNSALCWPAPQTGCRNVPSTQRQKPI